MPVKPTVAQAELMTLLRSLYHNRPKDHHALIKAIDRHARNEYGRGYHDGSQARESLPWTNA